MTRIAPLPANEFPFGARILRRFTKKMFGEAPDSLGFAAHSPGLVWSSAWMDKFFVGDRSVPNRLIELVFVRVAMEVGCAFCIDLGSSVAHRHHGVSKEELLALSHHGDSPLFTEAEKAALDLAVAMSQLPSSVDDALFARLAEHFDERQIVELTSAVAWENYRSRMNVAFGMSAQGFAEPGVCAIPAPGAIPASSRTAEAPAPAVN